MSLEGKTDVFVAAIACPRCSTELSNQLSCDRCGWIEHKQDAEPVGGNAIDGKSKDGIGWQSDSNDRDDIARGNFFSFAIGSFLIIGLLVSILVSVIQESPGIAICFAIIALPPVVRTALVTWHRHVHGRATSSLLRSKMFVSSLMVTSLIGAAMAGMSIVFSVVAGLMSLISLLFFCFAKPREYVASDVAYSTTGWMLILAALTPFIVWIVIRWQTDLVRK